MSNENSLDHLSAQEQIEHGQDFADWNDAIDNKIAVVGKCALEYLSIDEFELLCDEDHDRQLEHDGQESRYDYDEYFDF